MAEDHIQNKKVKLNKFLLSYSFPVDSFSCFIWFFLNYVNPQPLTLLNLPSTKSSTLYSFKAQHCLPAWRNNHGFLKLKCLLWHCIPYIVQVTTENMRIKVFGNGWVAVESAYLGWFPPKTSAPVNICEGVKGGGGIQCSFLLSILQCRTAV